MMTKDQPILARRQVSQRVSGVELKWWVCIAQPAGDAHGKVFRRRSKGREVIFGPCQKTGTLMESAGLLNARPRILAVCGDDQTRDRE